MRCGFVFSAALALVSCGESHPPPSDAAVRDAPDDPIARLSPECAAALGDASCRGAGDAAFVGELDVPDVCLAADCKDLCEVTHCWYGGYASKPCHRSSTNSFSCAPDLGGVP